MIRDRAEIVKQLKTGKVNLWHVDHQDVGRSFFMGQKTVLDAPPNDAIVLFLEARNPNARGPAILRRNVMNNLVRDNVIEPYCEDGRRVFYRLKGE